MDLADLEMFLALVEHRDVERTARRLSVSPTRVSSAVRAIEAERGAQLVEPTKAGVALTAQATRFRSRVHRGVAELRAAIQETRADQGRGARVSSPAPALRAAADATAPASNTPRRSRHPVALKIDHRRRAVTVGTHEVYLTITEFELLALIAEQNGAICERERLIAEVRASNWAGAQRNLNSHMASLRAKLGIHNELIQTVRGVGYRLAVESSDLLHSAPYEYAAGSTPLAVN